MRDGFAKILPEGRGDRVLLILATIGSLITLYFLFFYERAARFTSALQVGTLTTKGTVRRRHAKSLHWEDIKAEDAIYLRDIVYTPRDARATVVFGDKRTLELEPDSMVQFDEVTLDFVEITLFDGKVKGDVLVTREEKQFKLMPYPRHTQMARLPEVRGLELKGAELEQRYALYRLRRPPRLEYVKLTSSQSLDLKHLDDYELRLIKPLRDKFSLKANRWMKMVWSSIPLDRVVFEIEVAKDPGFKKMLSHRTEKNELQLQFDEEAIYYWRVRAQRGGERTMSGVSTFTMTGQGTRALPLALRAPTSDLASGFTAEVSQDSKFATILKSTIEKKPECPKGLLRPGTYYCRVRGIANRTAAKAYRFDVR